MDTFDPCLLPDSIVEQIRLFIQNKREEEKGKGHFLNEMIREDIFPLLDQFCTIVYYPIEDKNNNGFHKIYSFGQKKEQFVYINTNQDREKQIFTAAHELGHVWGLDQFLKNKLLNVDIDEDLCEKVMNRFAAELLMPNDIFLCFFDNAVSSIVDNGKVYVDKLIMPITDAMNEFFVPYKAVIYRLFEIKRISESGLKCLWDYQDVLIELSNEYAKEQHYDRLYKPDQKKYIEGLQTRLQFVKDEKLLPDAWIESLCKKFDIKIEEKKDIPNETVEIQKGDSNAEN